MYSYASLCRALAGTDDPQEEACLLLSHFCGAGRAALLCDRERTYESSALDAAVQQRLTGYPLQYILGEWYFFGCRFRVSPACLIPRPDTEILVEAGLARLQPGAVAADLCTGSGCIATALLVSRPDMTLCAGLELFPETLALAQENAACNGVGERFLPVCADLLTDGADRLRRALCARLPERQDGQVDMILSNPPYIREAELPELAPELAFEPRAALDGGTDGLTFYRAILNRYGELLRPGGWLLLEIGWDQADDLRRLAGEAGGWTDAEVRQDLGGRDRVICLRRTVRADGA